APRARLGGDVSLLAVRGVRHGAHVRYRRGELAAARVEDACGGADPGAAAEAAAAVGLATVTPNAASVATASCDRVPTGLHGFRRNPWGQRHQQEARQRVDVGFVRRPQRHELCDGCLVRAQPKARGRENALESLVLCGRKPIAWGWCRFETKDGA